MSRLILTLLICIFAVTTFSANAANKGRSNLKKSNITPIQKQQKPQIDHSSDKPLSSENYQIQAKETVQASPADMSPPKPTDVNYTPLPSLNDRNPISN
ncbi:MAG: hypothetical protein ACAH05_00705 [Methylophilus sp.]|nr:hypothetical protein [Methylophilus sp.]